MAAPEGRPSFHDPSLRQALEEAAPDIEQFTARLDALSSDIKSLEAYLERSAVRMTVSVIFSVSRQWNSPRGAPAFGEYLAWDRGEPDRFRIVYYRLEPGEDYPEQHDRCVLIEAPVEVRVRARRALPDLLRAVSRAASLGTEDEPDWPRPPTAGGGPPPGDDDIPF
jgi:hypothetical protein